MKSLIALFVLLALTVGVLTGCDSASKTDTTATSTNAPAGTSTNK